METVEVSNLRKIAGSVVTLFIIYNITRLIYTVYFHPLSKYPGPTLLAVSPLFSWYRLFRGTEIKDQFELHKKYGSVVRIGPNALSFSSGQAWKDIAGFIQNKRQLRKDPITYGRGQRGTWSIITTPDDNDHARHRRNLAHAFSDQALREQEPLIKPYFDTLIEQLKKQIDGPAKGKVDIIRWYNYTTFDVIGDLAFGESFHALDSGDYHPWVANIFASVKLVRYVRLVLIYPVLRALLVALFMAMPSLNRSRRVHVRYSEEKIEKRLAQDTDRKDFVSYILRAQEKPLSDNELKNDLQLIILAGSETTATTLSGLTYFLLKNPRVYQKLLKEITSKFSSEDEINFLSTARCSYLTAVIEETFRLYPPVPGRMPRLTGSEGNTIDGHHIPPNTSVGVMSYAAGRLPSNWHNPDEFFPERFTDEAPPEYASDDRSSLQPFSVGPRNCIGRNLAYNELRTIVVRMLWNFDLQLEQESADWINQTAYMLWEKPPLYVTLRRRT